MSEETKEPIITLSIPLSGLKVLRNSLPLYVRQAEELYEQCNRLYGDQTESELTKAAWENFCNLQTFAVDFINGKLEEIPTE